MEKDKNAEVTMERRLIARVGRVREAICVSARLVGYVFSCMCAYRHIERLEARNKDLERMLESLGFCRVFGMYTREYFLHKVKELGKEADRKYALMFLDLDHMHSLNAELGYDRVNDLVRELFAVRRLADCTGRWFSGDEIVSVVDWDEIAGMVWSLQRKSREISEREGVRLNFMFEIAEFCPELGNIESEVAVLSEKVMEQKKVRDMKYRKRAGVLVA